MEGLLNAEIAIRDASSKINEIQVTDPDDVIRLMEANGFLTWALKRLSDLSINAECEEDRN